MAKFQRSQWLLRRLSAIFFASIISAVGSAQAAVIDVNLDVTLGPTNFFPNFFQLGENLTFSPGGPVQINDGDTARVRFNFAEGQAVRVFGPTVNEIAISFLGAGQFANPGTSRTQVDLTFDLSLNFLGASGDLLLPSLSRPNQRNVGGGFGPGISENFTDSSFLFRGVEFEFANIKDNNAAAGITEPHRILPRNFDTVGFRMLSAEGVELVENAFPVPEPSTLPLMAMALLVLSWFGRRIRPRDTAGAAPRT